MRDFRPLILSAAVLLLGLTIQSVSAQGGPTTAPAGTGAWTAIDPAARKQWYDDMFEKALDASDEEWKVIQPRLTAVQEAQTAQWGFVVPAQPKDPPKPDPADPNAAVKARMTGFEPNELGKALNELRQTLADKNAPADAIKTKMDAWRKAREKALAERKAAQQKLREVLSVRQEGQLIIMGMLD